MAEEIREKQLIPVSGVHTLFAIKQYAPHEARAPAFGTHEWKRLPRTPIGIDIGKEKPLCGIACSCSVIAWTEEDGRTLIVSYTNLLATDSQMRFTDTVFPVICCRSMVRDGIYAIIPTTTEDFQTNYREKVGLALVEDFKGPDAVQREMLVPGDRESVKKVVTTMRAVIRCYYLMGESMHSLGYINRIIDRHNPQYPYIGLFAGQSFEVTENEKTLQLWPNSRFRTDVHYTGNTEERTVGTNQPTDRFITRYGYLVSKYALLVVSEQIQKTGAEDNRLTTTTLLKESTFLLFEGQAMFKRYYTTQPHAIPLPRLSFGIPYESFLVIIGEGVNAIQIIKKDSESFRTSYLYLNQTRIHPSCVDWYQFQSDFQLSGPPYEPPFKQVMQLKDINDCIKYESNALNCEFLWAMSAYIQYDKRGKDVTEMWNIFVKIPQTEDWYVLLKRVYTIQWRTNDRNNEAFAKGVKTMAHSLGSDVITMNKFKRFEQQFQRIQRLMERISMNDQSVKHMVETVGLTPNDQIMNAGEYTKRREELIRYYNFRFVRK